jgi:hypothetical protein
MDVYGLLPRLTAALISIDLLRSPLFCFLAMIDDDAKAKGLQAIFSVAKSAVIYIIVP